jgi:hypothetical protein
MHIILADSIDGGVLLFLFLIVGGITSLIALIGLSAAWKGARASTMRMILPAIVCWVVITIHFVSVYVKYGLHDPKYNVKDLMFMWVFVSGAPFAASAITFCVLGLRHAKANRAKESA